MRRLIVLLGVCLALLCGCAREPIAVPAAGNAGMRTSMQPRQSQPLCLWVGDETITLPLTVAQARDMGYVPKLPLENGDLTVQPAQLSAAIAFRGNGVSFTGYVQNTGNEPLEPCEWMPVVWLRMDAAEQSADVRLPGGLSLAGLTADQVIAAYGEPQEKSATGQTIDLRYGLDLDKTFYVLTNPRTGEVLAVELIAYPATGEGVL